MEPRVLAELNVWHTRRHQPTRRVALTESYLPANGNAYGPVLLGAVVSEHFGELDEDQVDQLPRFVADARRGSLRIPRIAMRFRLQTDTHGLDRSRHRLLAEPDGLILELDRHGRGSPQLIGSLMAAAALGDAGRRTAFRAVDAAVHAPGVLPTGVRVRRLREGIVGAVPLAGLGARVADFGTVDGNGWQGIPVDRRWAMEVLGFRAGATLTRAEVQRRFRRLVLLAHPDHGAAPAGAAEQLAELADARSVLLAFASVAAPDRG